MTSISPQYGQGESLILKVRDLSQRELWPWVKDTISDWVVIALAFYFVAITHSFLIGLVALFVIGNRQHALAILGHEGTHITVVANRKWNDLLSNMFCFWPILFTIDGYRRLHFAHHKHTGNADDPELLHKQARAPQWDLPFKKSKVLLYMIKDVFGYSIPDLFIILTFGAPEKKALLLPVVILQFAFLVTAIALGYWWIPVMWYGAMATTFMMFFRIRLWFEHQGTFETQRIFLTPIQAAVIAPHKIWLHWEHHKYPAVPYYNLEKVRQLFPAPQPMTLSQLVHELSMMEYVPSGANRGSV